MDASDEDAPELISDASGGYAVAPPPPAAAVPAALLCRLAVVAFAQSIPSHPSHPTPAAGGDSPPRLAQPPLAPRHGAALFQPAPAAPSAAGGAGLDEIDRSEGEQDWYDEEYYGEYGGDEDDDGFDEREDGGFGYGGPAGFLGGLLPGGVDGLLQGLGAPVDDALLQQVPVQVLSGWWMGAGWVLGGFWSSSLPLCWESPVACAHLLPTMCLYAAVPCCHA